VVEGNVYAYTSVSSLLPLSCLERITGSLLIDGATVETLAGLEKLQSVGSLLAIQNAPYLEDLRGLASLRSVGEAVLITGNAALKTLDGVSDLPLQSSVTIAENPQLSDLGPFRGVTSLVGSLRPQRRHPVVAPPVHGYSTGAGGANDVAQA
jgi:hypothetical protein